MATSRGRDIIKITEELTFDVSSSVILMMSRPSDVAMDGDVADPCSRTYAKRR